MKLNRSKLRKMILKEMSGRGSGIFGKAQQVNQDLEQAIQDLYMQVLSHPEMGPQIRGGGGEAIAMMYESQIMHMVQEYLIDLDMNSRRYRAIVLDRLQTLIRNT